MRVFKVVCYFLKHKWQFGGGIFASCTRCKERAIYVGEGPR